MSLVLVTQEFPQKLSVSMLRYVEDRQYINDALGELEVIFRFRLADHAYRALPALVERDFGIRVDGRLKRAYLYDAQGKPLEVKIFGGLRSTIPTIFE